MKKLAFGFMCWSVLLCVSDAFACTAASREQTAPTINLIERTSNIVLAQVTKMELVGNDAVVTFKPREVIKGSGVAKFSLRFSVPGNVDFNMTTTFNNHRDAGFWMGRSHRSILLASCQLTTTFEIGSYYLMFLDKPFHFDSFEKITSEDDKWLTAVRDAVRGAGNGKIELTLNQFIQSTYSAYIGKCPLNFKKRRFEVIEWVHGTQEPISQMPAIYKTGFKCRGYGAEYLGIKTSKNDMETALPIIDGNVDFSGLHMDLIIKDRHLDAPVRDGPVLQ